MKPSRLNVAFVLRLAESKKNRRLNSLRSSNYPSSVYSQSPHMYVRIAAAECYVGDSNCRSSGPLGTS